MRSLNRFSLDPGIVLILLIFPAGIFIASPVLLILEALHVRTAMNWTMVTYFYLLPAYMFWRHKCFEPVDNVMAWGLPFLWACLGTIVVLFTVPAGVVLRVGSIIEWLWTHAIVNAIGYGLALAVIVCGVLVVSSLIGQTRSRF